MPARRSRPPAIDRRPLERRLPELCDRLLDAGALSRPGDVAAVKYEMLRRHRVDGLSITRVAALFGVSRQTVYNVARDFDAHGMRGLGADKPRSRPGPRRRWKCTREVVAYAKRRRRARPEVALRELARDIERRFSVRITAGALAHALAAQDRSSRTRPSRRPSS